MRHEPDMGRKTSTPLTLDTRVRWGKYEGASYREIIDSDEGYSLWMWEDERVPKAISDEFIEYWQDVWRDGERTR
jgi:uncharacterized protein (DUF3820 family)